MVKDGWREFIALCVKMKSSKDLEQLLDLFLTIEEKETLSSRFLIVKALFDGDLTQREIAEKHKVSIAQITRGSNALKIIPPKMRDLLKKSL